MTYVAVVQIKEGPISPESDTLLESGLESCLAQAEACLVSGQLSAAAAALQKVVQVGGLGILHGWQKSSSELLLLIITACNGLSCMFYV